MLTGNVAVGSCIALSAGVTVEAGIDFKNALTKRLTC